MNDPTEPLKQAPLSMSSFIVLNIILGPLVGAIISIAGIWAYDGTLRNGAVSDSVLFFVRALSSILVFAYLFAILPAAISAYLCMRFGASTRDGQVNYLKTMAIAFAVCFAYTLALRLLLGATQNQPIREQLESCGFFAAIGAVSALICSHLIRWLLRRFPPYEPDNET